MQASGKSILLQRRISGIENYQSSPRPAKCRRSTPGTVGASRIATPVPSGSLYKSWRSSLSTNASSLDKIQEDEETIDGPDVQQCLFAEENMVKVSDSVPEKKPRRSTRRSSIRRSVVFGPALSPEYFDKSLPPNTPLKKGTLPHPSVSFIGDQPLNELEQIIEEEEAQNSYSELFSSPDKARKKPTPKKPTPSKSQIEKVKAKSPKKLSTTPIQERKPAKKIVSPVKGTSKIRKSYGGITKKSTKQKRSSLPTSIKQSSRVELIGVPREEMKFTKDSTDGAAFGRPKKPIEAKKVCTPKKQKRVPNDEITKKLKKNQSEFQLATTFSAGNRSFVIENGKEKISKNRRSLPSSVLMKGASVTSLVPYTPTEDILALSQEQLSEVSKEDILDEESGVRASLPTPLKKAIQGGVLLKLTKPKLWTPLRKDLESGVVLRKLHRAMPTPVRKAITSNPILRATKKAMATPLRKEIEGKPKLRATKRAMATPIRKEIEGKPKLRATRNKMATPLRNEITAKPKLRPTKKKMPTPLRKDIESNPKLRAVMKSLPTPLKMDIKKKKNLKQTKPRMATPLQQSIKERPTLKKVMKSLSTPVRKEIESRPTLKQTKKMLPLSVRKEILQHPPLKPTKRRMETPLRQAIENPPPLKVTKKNETPTIQRRAPKRRHSRTEDNLPPQKKARAVVAINEVASCPVEYIGLQQLFKTPKASHGTPQEDVYQGIQKMFQTPKIREALSPNYEGVTDLFSTPSMPANVASRKVKFLSPVAMTAQRNRQSKNPTMVLNVPKLGCSEIVENVRRTRSQTAAIPFTLEDLPPDDQPNKKKSQRSVRRRTRQSTVASVVPEPEIKDNTVSTSATRSLRSRSKSLTLPVNELAPVEVKKKEITKKRNRTEKEKAKEGPTSKKQTRSTQPLKDSNVSPVRKTRQSKITDQVF